jgi:hypothetical protein
MRPFPIIATLTLLLALPAQAKPTDIQTINSLSFTDGNAFGSRTDKQSLNNFTEIPLSKRLSIGGNFQLNRATSSHNGSTTGYALNQVEPFVRYKIFAGEKLGITWHNSYKPVGIYNQNKYLAQMPRQADFETRFLFAINMKDRLVNAVITGNTPYFARLELGYRRKFNNPFDQVRFILWSGISITPKFAILFQDNIDWNIQSKSSALNNTPANFQMSKNANNIATLSLIYRYEKDMAIQFGAIRRLSGNNPFYDDKGVIVGLWNNF